MAYRIHVDGIARRRNHQVVEVLEVVARVHLARRCHGFEVDGEAAARKARHRHAQIVVGVIDHLRHRGVEMIDQSEVLRLMLEPDGVQLGGVVVLRQERHKAENVAGIRRQVGFFQLRTEPWRSPEVQCQRYVLREIMGGVALPVIAVKVAHLIGGGSRARKLAGFDQVGTHRRANGRRLRQLLVIAADVHGCDHTEQSFIDIDRRLGLRGRRDAHQASAAYHGQIAGTVSQPILPDSFVASGRSYLCCRALSHRSYRISLRGAVPGAQTQFPDAGSLSPATETKRSVF